MPLNLTFKCTITIFLVSFVSSAMGQGNNDKKAPKLFTETDKASQEIVAILAETNTLQDKNAYIKIQAKAAYLIWYRDEELARSVFNNLLTWIETQHDESFDQEKARTEALKYLMLRDPKTAKILLEKRSSNRRLDQKDNSVEPTIKAKIENELASDLISTNPSAAADLLEQNLPTFPSTELLSLLIRLRDKEIDRADKIAELTLGQLKTQPIQIALPIVFSLHYYFFPINSLPKVDRSLPPSYSLQKLYFLTAYETLLRSLQDIPPSSLNNSRTAMATPILRFAQGQLISILATLSTRFSPDRLEELSKLKAQLTLNMSAETASVAQTAADRLKPLSPQNPAPNGGPGKAENPMSEINSALSSNKYDEAYKLLENVDNPQLKKAILDQIKISECNYLLANDNFTNAALVARDILSLKNKMAALTKIIKLSYQKGNEEMSQILFTEVQSYFMNANCDRNKMSIFLAAFSDIAPLYKAKSVELLNSGINCINEALPIDVTSNNKGSRPSNTLPDLIDFTQAFSVAGRMDLDLTLIIASKIRNKPAGLLARLFACEKWLIENQQTGKPNNSDKEGSS